MGRSFFDGRMDLGKKMSAREEAVAFLRGLMKDEEEDSKNRLKAAELLRKFEDEEEREKDGEKASVVLRVEYL